MFVCRYESLFVKWNLLCLKTNARVKIEHLTVWNGFQVSLAANSTLLPELLLEGKPFFNVKLLGFYLSVTTKTFVLRLARVTV